jgi:hypothetical protein
MNPDEFQMAGYSENESLQLRYICELYGLEPEHVLSALHTLGSLLSAAAEVEKINPRLRHLAFRSKKFRVRKKNRRRYAQCIGSNY